MICLRFDLRRQIVLYMQGLLVSPKRERVEDHLVNCATCRRRLELMAEGEKLAQQLPRVQAPASVSWDALQRQIRSASAPVPARPFRLSTAAAVSLVVFLVAAVSFLWWMKPGAGDFNADEFHAVPLSGMESNVEPHVATEGYISEVRRSGEDGDLLFKLVDDIHTPNHFVMCEVIEPVKLDVPPVGSRIRVYGVHRYDAKATHQWYEVHPVLNIERVQ